VKIDIPTFHCVEYIYAFIINKVVKDLKGITILVKTNEQIFIFGMLFTFVKLGIISGSIKSPSNIRLTYAMLKSRRVELNDNVHYKTIVDSFVKNKPLEFCLARNTKTDQNMTFFTLANKR